MTTATVLGTILASYAAAGLLTALAFATVGVRQVIAHPGSTSPPTFTLGARLLIVPGVAALWPYVLARWLKARTQE
jgi:hypothetical protein